MTSTLLGVERRLRAPISLSWQLVRQSAAIFPRWFGFTESVIARCVCVCISEIDHLGRSGV